MYTVGVLNDVYCSVLKYLLAVTYLFKGTSNISNYFFTEQKDRYDKCDNIE